MKFISLPFRGEEFRPAFKGLGEITCIFEEACHLALTASATRASVNDLMRTLKYQDSVLVMENVDRPNIVLEVNRRLPNVKKFDKYNSLIEPIVEELKEKQTNFPVTIMYMENLESLGYFYQYIAYELGDAAYSGVATPENRIFAQYHKDYPESMKKIILKELIKPKPKLRLVLATVALGMGVNAPGIEQIIHCRPPTTMEAYLQEIGRAGRAGQPARAIMHFNNSDIAKNRKGLSDEMRLFCMHDGCLRQKLVLYFGFDSVKFSGEQQNCCSNCKGTR